MTLFFIAACTISAYPCFETNWTTFVAQRNTETLNSLLASDTTVLIGEGRFPMMGGVAAYDEHNLTLDVGGIIDFGLCDPPDSQHCTIDKDEYPSGTPMMHFTNMTDFTLTSTNGRGEIWGGGGQWYGFADLLLTNKKPIMLSMIGEPSTHVEISHLRFMESPYWTIYLEASWVSVHHVTIVASDKGALGGVKAFNTDGIDVAGDHVHIHNSEIYVGDDCVAVKGGSHWLVERVRASGLGMTIGKAGVARNITFRHIHMEATVRAIYIKTEAHDVLYHNITVGRAKWFPIWIGPAYQFLKGDCSLLWPLFRTSTVTSLSELVYHDSAYLSALCRPSTNSFGTNITLSDIFIGESATAPMVLIGNERHYEVTLKNVTIGKAPTKAFPFSNVTACYNTTVNGRPCHVGACLAVGDRDPVVPCCGGYDPMRGGQWGECHE